MLRVDGKGQSEALLDLKEKLQGSDGSSSRAPTFEAAETVAMVGMFDLVLGH